MVRDNRLIRSGPGIARSGSEGCCKRLRSVQRDHAHSSADDISEGLEDRMFNEELAKIVDLNRQMQAETPGLEKASVTETS